MLAFEFVRRKRPSLPTAGRRKLRKAADPCSHRALWFSPSSITADGQVILACAALFKCKCFPEASSNASDNAFHTSLQNRSYRCPTPRSCHFHFPNPAAAQNSNPTGIVPSQSDCRRFVLAASVAPSRRVSSRRWPWSPGVRVSSTC